MTIPFPEPPKAPAPIQQPEIQAQPFYVRQTQDWAITAEHQRHDQVLYTVGEYAMFVLLWHLQDFDAGLVGRCTVCSGQAGSPQAAVAQVYKQPVINRCPSCYGTTFQGGIKAQIVRPAIFGDADQAEQVSSRGIVHPEDIQVESTADFRIRTGDYAFRSTGERYYLRAPRRTTLRTGFGTPTQSTAAINYNLARASLEDSNASVAYMMPPAAAALSGALQSASAGYPANFATLEQINGPLIPTLNEGD